MFPTDQREQRPSTAPAGLVLAGIGRRALGTILDQVLILLPVAIAAVVYGFRPGDTVSDDGLLALNLGMAVVALVYETIMIGLLGRTVGKFATSTRVVRLIDGGRVGWIAALQRSLVPVVASAVPVVGWVLAMVVYAFAFLGPLRQGLHDRAAGTLVVMNGRHTPI